MLAARKLFRRTSYKSPGSPIGGGGKDLVISGEDIDLRMPFATVKVDERLGGRRAAALQNGTLCVVRRPGRAWMPCCPRPPIATGGSIAFSAARNSFCLAVSLCAFGGGRVQMGLAVGRCRGSAATCPPPSALRYPIRRFDVLDRGILLPSRSTSDRQRASEPKFHALRLPEGGTADGRSIVSSLAATGSKRLHAAGRKDQSCWTSSSRRIDNDPQILATLAHEERPRAWTSRPAILLQSTAVGAFLAFYVGDISSLLAAAPAAPSVSKVFTETWNSRRMIMGRQS